MPKLAVILLTFAFTSAAIAGPRVEKQIAKLMNGKDLVCNPAVAVKTDPAYKGDDGYFRLTIDKKLGLTVADNGGDGYGFANGNVNDLLISVTKIVLEVGDDGHQDLLFDFADLGGSSEFADNCAQGALVDYSTGYFMGDSIVIVCCLEAKK